MRTRDFLLLLAATTSAAPTPPTPLTKLAIVGDSNAADSNGAYTWSRRWIAENPGVAAQNFALAGACIRASENAGNNLVAGIPALVTYGPSHLIIHIGTNDLKTLSAATYLTYLFDYIAQVRAAIPGIVIICTTILPATMASHVNINPRRGAANTAMRAAVGNQIDAILPFGTHPIVGLDTSPDNPDLSFDKLHWIAKGNYYLYQVMNDVMGPIIAASVATSPPSTGFFDVNDAPLSSNVYSQSRVTGLRIGTSAAVSCTGNGDFTVGTDAAGTAGVGMNGDVIISRLASSGSNVTDVQQAISVGATAKTITVKTKPSSYATTVTLDPANKYNTTLTNGNLTAEPSDGNIGNHPIRSTKSFISECIYFEVTPPGIAGGSYIVVMDSSVPLTATRLPGQSGGYINAGLSMILGNSVVVYTKGLSLQSLDYIAFGTTANGEIVGMAIDCAAGRVWIRKGAGWLHGNPETRDGGFLLTAPLAQYWPYGGPRQNPGAISTNYGASAFAYPVPVGFRPPV